MTKAEFMELVRAQGEAECPTCSRKARHEDPKTLNRWMAVALDGFYEFNSGYPNAPFHAGTLLKGTDGSRGHDSALLRHWGLIAEVPRPVDAPKKMKGSRGLTGWYVLTQRGVDFREGKISVPREVCQMFDGNILIRGEPISYDQALRVKLKVGANNITLDGTEDK